jgi:acyl-CoA-binding protein
MDDLQKRFETAAEEVQHLATKPGNDILLKLYALYKQGTQGNASGARPGFTNPVGRAKYDAWRRLSGRPREQAMADYIDLVEQLKRKP